MQSRLHQMWCCHVSSTCCYPAKVGPQQQVEPRFYYNLTKKTPKRPQKEQVANFATLNATAIGRKERQNLGKNVCLPLQHAPSCLGSCRGCVCGHRN